MLTGRTRFVIASSLGLVGIAAATTAMSSGTAGHVVSSIAPFATTTCASTNPCIIYQNNESGAGLRGISVGGNGLTGVTKLATSGASPAAGVVGLDKSNGTKNSGVKGISSLGSGVIGISNSGEATGVLPYGVIGQANGTAGSGVLGLANGEGDGIVGIAQVGNGVYGSTNDNGDFNGSAVWGNSPQGIGVRASSVGGVSLEVEGGALPLKIQEMPGTAPENLIEAFQGGGTDVLSLGDDGNLHITGKLFTAGSCSSGCTTGRHARRVVSYAPAESQPSMEDFGKGQLVNGKCYVSLDLVFANVIDARSDYLVFITPEGDSRGLYIADKSHKGFSVRENQGGRSTLAFDYRIVAKPFADTSKRLPMVEQNDPPINFKHNRQYSRVQGHR